MTTNLIALITLTVLSVAAVASTVNAAPMRCLGRVATIVGTNQGEELVGTNGRDVIVGRGGADRIEARGGRDLICAGRGGFDVVFGGRGDDRIAGQAGFDAAFPGPGDDFFDGGRGGGYITYEGTHTPVRADLRSGVVIAQGRDRVKNVEGVGGSEAADVLIGNNGSNGLEAYGGNDVIRGLGGADFIAAGAGDDAIEGGDGDHDFLNLVLAHAGPDLDDDTLATSGAVVDFNTGNVSGGADVGQDTFAGIEGLGGTMGDDTIRGDAHHNELVAFDGADSLQGGDGDDVLAPGPGDDIADGGPGDDVADYFLSHPFEAGTHGPVTVDLGGTQTATGAQGTDDLNSFEGAVGTGHDDTLTGSSGADILLLGGPGSDSISGEAGDDYLDGDAFFFGVPENLPGSDSLDGGAGEDVCVGGETTEECEAFKPTELAAVRSSTQAMSSLALVEFLRELNLSTASGRSAHRMRPARTSWTATDRGVPSTSSYALLGLLR
jgi:Ca2+-binding RTX toxin-like protein